MADLPAHLQKSQLPRLSDRATEGMGSAMPPHISIRSNAFNLIDAAGEETSVDTKHLDVAIIDFSDIVCKRYMDPAKPWTPDSKDPPLCWSSNGFGPSKEAIQPQAATCQECPNNIRGSAVSKLTGTSVKACRDEKFLAVILDGYGDLIFRLVLTPGSFNNWKAFAEKFKKQPFDIRDVITRLQFEKDTNGVLTFTPANWLTPDMTQLRNKLVTSKATDGIVGRLDQPIQGQIAAPLSGAPVQQLADANGPQGKPAEAPKKRGRPPASHPGNEPAPANGGPTMAPFRPDPPPGGPTFGIETPAAPPAELANDLDAFFKS